MTNMVIGYTVTLVLLLTIITFQLQLTFASPIESINKSQSVVNDSIVNCAALGCPGNSPNPHGPPTDEP